MVAVLAAAGPRPLRAQDDIGLPMGRVPEAAAVQDTSGATVSLARHIGRRPVVFEFWATWCEVCATLLPRMQAAQRRYGDRVDFVVVGVGVNQTLRTIKRHLASHPEPFTFYFDREGAAVRAFQVPATGVIIALDARGRVVYAGAGTGQDPAAIAQRTLTTR